MNNEPVATAEAQITAAHLRWHVTEEPNSTVAVGHVISSDPPQGNNVAANTIVTLYVSTGAAPVAVPNVVGQQQAPAESELESKGFKVLVNPDAASTVAAGQVISQNPSGGTAAPGSTITITVSGGAVPVPNVVGDSQSTATQILQEAGFNVTAQQGSGPSSVPTGTVFNQLPSTGTAAKGSTVTITVQIAATPSPSVTPTPNPSGSGGTGAF